MKVIDDDIKNGQFKRVYLLHGEEKYLILQYKKKLLEALVSPGDNMNFSSFEGKDINPGEIIDLAETMPFLAEKRVLLIENSGFFKKGCEELAEYILNIPQTTVLIFVEDEVDGKVKLTKNLKKAGYDACINTVEDNLLTKWILGRVKKDGKVMTEAAFQRFLQKTGKNMDNIDKELEKLLSYCLEKNSIEVGDVEAVVIEQIEEKLFDMVDKIAMHQQKEALELYYNLLELNEAPMRILYNISKHFQTLASVKVLTGQGYGNKDIAAKTGCKDWAVKKYQNQNRNFSLSLLKRLVEMGVVYETDVKQGNLNDRMAVELFIVQCSKAE